MSRIRGKDTKPELIVRKYLFSKGFRYRKNVKSLPGTPDIVLPKYNTVIFINGCFWHRHKGCKYATTPKTRTEFWMSKFERNIENDNLHTAQLEKMGFNVITIWECQLKGKQFDQFMNNIVEVLLQNKRKS